MKNEESLFGSRILSVSLYLISLAGGCLAVYQYFFNRSLWLDEAYLALNVINRDFFGLAQPLDFHQVAPIGFLFIEKIFVVLLGNNEFALRLFPLVAFLTSIPFFYLLSRRLAGNNTLALLATSIFSIAKFLIDYASEVKQYSLDVLLALVILHCTLKLEPRRGGHLVLYALTGAVAVWFSNVSIIVLFVAGLYSLYYGACKGRNYRILIPLLVWAASFLLYYCLFVHDHPARNVMANYWEDAFMSLNPFSGDFYRFLLRVIIDLYGFLLGFGGTLWFVPLVISLAAIGYIVKHRSHTLLYFCLAPVAVHLLLSGLRLYPFSGRLVLYLLPLIILVFSVGLYSLFELVNARVFRLPGFLLILPALLMAYPICSDFPIEKEEIKKSLSYMTHRIKGDETIYLYHLSEPAFRFYRITGVTDLQNRVIVGEAPRDENRGYDRRLGTLTGRVWLLFSHVYPFTKTDNEETHAVEFLVGSGAEILDVKKYEGSSVYSVDTKKAAPG